MPGPPRFSYAHATHHVTLRCNSTIIEAESCPFRCLAHDCLNPVRGMETRFALNRPDALVRRERTDAGIVLAAPRPAKGPGQAK